MSATLDAALSYVDRGWALLPVASDGSKQPHYGVLNAVYGTASWKPLAARRASPVEVRAWFEHDPGCNIGVILGEPSGGLLVVVDVDRPEKAKGLRHPPTPIVRTARGFHVYLRAESNGWTPVKTVSTPFGELRGAGSYVVLPPSRHESGHSYYWEVSPDDVALASLDDLRGADDLLEKRGTQSEVPLTVYPKVVSPLSGTDGGALAQLEPAVNAALRVLGVQARPGAKFTDVLPGLSPDRHPSASTVRGTDGIWRYRSWRGGPGVPANGMLTLAEVRASIGYGRVLQLRGPSQAMWYRRLFYEAGLVVAEPVPLAVPDDSSPTARRLADGFALLLALRALSDGGPAPYTRKFAAAWCGIGERQAAEAIVELVRAGVLVRTGTHGPCNLYEPARSVNAAAKRAA